LTRLTNLVYSSGTGTLLSIQYGFDNGDRRTSEMWKNSRNVSYGYDGAYQLLSGTSTTRPSDNVSYSYDKSGNPLSRLEMGLTSGYTFNNLNQFTSGTWTGKLTVAGELNYAAGTVTVNGVMGQIFPDRTFEATNVSVSAGSNLLTAVYIGPAFTNTAMTATSKVSVTVGNPAFGYDAKGNLTNDAEFTYFYDLANQLTNVISKSLGSSVLSAKYDGMGRRVEVTRSGTNVERYVYFPASFLVLAVLDGSNQIKEVWSHGPDLSGKLDGAGGIGGVLSVSTNVGTASASKYFHGDAQGNVSLVTGSVGQQVATYRYTPFGKLIGQVGNYNARFTFSSKEWDTETGLLYYGYRYYSPDVGRWLARDPMEEDGVYLLESSGLTIEERIEHSSALPTGTLYLFVKNDPIGRIDRFGLKTYTSMASQYRSVGEWGALLHHVSNGKPGAFRRLYFNTLTFPLNCPKCQKVRTQPAAPAACSDCQVIDWNGGSCTVNGHADVSVGTDLLRSMVRPLQPLSDALKRLSETLTISYDCEPCGAP